MLPLLLLRPNDVRNLFWQKETSERKNRPQKFYCYATHAPPEPRWKKQKKILPTTPLPPPSFFSIFVNPSHTPNFGVASSSSFQRVIFQNQEERVEGGGSLAVILELNVGGCNASKMQLFLWRNIHFKFLGQVLANLKKNPPTHRSFPNACQLERCQFACLFTYFLH